jgi:ATP-dependent DNA ligase
LSPATTLFRAFGSSSRRSRRSPARSSLTDGEAIVTNDDGPPVFHLIHHKRRGDGIVFKRHTALYRSDRSMHWVKVKNLEAPAVKRPG